MSEVIDIRISRPLFDKYVKEGILSPDHFCVLEVQNQDVFASPLYVSLMDKIHTEYDNWEKAKKTHRLEIKRLYKQLDELQHGSETNG